MFNKNIFKIFFIILFFLIISVFNFSDLYAQPSDPYDNPDDLYGYGAFEESSLGDRDPRSTVVSIINFSLSVIGVICTVLIVYAGYLWMTAGGNDEQVGKAKKIIISAIIGLIIVLLSYAISNFVIVNLYEASQSKPYGGKSLFD